MIKTWSNFNESCVLMQCGHWRYARGEHNTQPSLTIPNQVLPLDEMLRRYVRGQDVQMFSPVYDEDLAPGYENLGELDRIDLARSMKDDLRQAVSRSTRTRSTGALEPDFTIEHDPNPVFNEPPPKEEK